MKLPGHQNYYYIRFGWFKLTLADYEQWQTAADTDMRWKSKFFEKKYGRREKK